MKQFDAEKLVEEMTMFIRDWVNLLAQDNFELACQVLDSNNIYVWNTESIKEVFLQYWRGEMPVINNPYTMDLTKERVDFYEYDDGSGYAADYDIPMENDWGDLTAKFSFVEITQGFYHTYLTDIRML